MLYYVLEICNDSFILTFQFFNTPRSVVRLEFTCSPEKGHLLSWGMEVVPSWWWLLFTCQLPTDRASSMIPEETTRVLPLPFCAACLLGGDIMMMLYIMYLQQLTYVLYVFVCVCVCVRSIAMYSFGFGSGGGGCARTGFLFSSRRRLRVKPAACQPVSSQSSVSVSVCVLWWRWLMTGAMVARETERNRVKKIDNNEQKSFSPQVRFAHTQQNVKIHTQRRMSEKGARERSNACQKEDYLIRSL